MWWRGGVTNLRQKLSWGPPTCEAPHFVSISNETPIVGIPALGLESGLPLALMLPSTRPGPRTSPGTLVALDATHTITVTVSHGTTRHGEIAAVLDVDRQSPLLRHRQGLLFPGPPQPLPSRPEAT
jgi:hypothetical protein